MDTPRIRDGWTVVLFAAMALTASSAGIFDRYLGGGPALVALVLGAAFVLYSVFVWLVRYGIDRLPDRAANSVTLAVLVFLVAAFAVVYPREGAPQIAGAGGDQDDAVNILADHLGSLSSPYSELTYLGNPISNMAGSAVLGWPFRELFGTSAWMNPVIIVGAAFAVWLFAGARVAAFASVATASSLGFFASYVTGGDYFVVAILLVVAAWWLRSSKPNSWQEYVAALLLAVVGTTRTHLVALTVIVLVVVIAQKGRRSLPAAGIGGLVVAGLSLMWFVPDPGGFTPLGNTTSIAGGAWPTSAMVVVSFVLVALAATRRIDAQHLWLFGAAIIATQLIWVPTQIYRGAPFALFAVPLLVGTLAVARSGDGRVSRFEPGGVTFR